MQEQRHESFDRSRYPLVREKKLLKWSDHKPLGQDAVKYRHTAPDNPGHSQGSILPIRAHTRLNFRSCRSTRRKLKHPRHFRSIRSRSESAVSCTPERRRERISRNKYASLKAASAYPTPSGRMLEMQLRFASIVCGPGCQVRYAPMLSVADRPGRSPMRTATQFA